MTGIIFAWTKLIWIKTGANQRQIVPPLSKVLLKVSSCYLPGSFSLPLLPSAYSLGVVLCKAALWQSPFFKTAICVFFELFTSQIWFWSTYCRHIIEAEFVLKKIWNTLGSLYIKLINITQMSEHSTVTSFPEFTLRPQRIKMRHVLLDSEKTRISVWNMSS